MAQLKLGAAGVTANEIDISGPVAQQPVGTPAGIVGTAKKGPAFVPVTVGLLSDFQGKFGTVDSKHFGPLAVYEWLRNAQAVTYLRVLGVGNGLERQNASQTYPGSVTNSGFVVGERQPSGTVGKLDNNPYANLNGAPGRAYMLGCFMSESAGSTFLSDAGLQASGQNVAAPVLRGVIMAASGVLLRLSYLLLVLLLPRQHRLRSVPMPVRKERQSDRLFSLRILFPSKTSFSFLMVIRDLTSIIQTLSRRLSTQHQTTTLLTF